MTATVHQESYIVLIGDGKTHECLMEVKRLYGSTVNKLLIFPRDWHTLANFQPVLIKIYYAGLKEIAQRSGYNGETIPVWDRAMIYAFHTNNPNVHELLIHPHMTTSNMLKNLSSFVRDAGTV